ncbi:hypothetical protein AVEN_203948-1 [Araneus ventricosus]|uniref:Uncharacterized protein n=1 Tax=Araneus ventricosus TaxID=182803 RepID=A0A4Y2U497_ARAVE|nr:hypothetical protein AVEN_261014-1 [Araneus ventricosus]GBO07650.1 hypothetical protein AVEN_37473-1 [Araneus ventricosus]GBO07658.1 hypothetical protein AVEN_141046-1 [Araneus ventricosus]GBO07666.1 hypothetical protein AVEN_203948-1 [Araneus ventricosus]
MSESFYELSHRQGLDDKSAKAFPGKPFRKPFPQNSRKKAFYEPPVPFWVASSGWGANGEGRNLTMPNGLYRAQPNLTRNE